MGRSPLRTSALCAALAVGGAAALLALPSAPDARGRDRKQSVDDMDIDLLRENLLKIWIVEESSSLYNQSRIGQKSFDALVAPVQPSGDPAKDKENAEGRRKLDKEIRHYIQLELDGAVECIDIVERVLGTKVTLGSEDAARRRFLLTPTPEIKWTGQPIQRAFEDLAARTRLDIRFAPLPKTIELDVSLDSPAGLPLVSVLEFLRTQHEIEWTFAGNDRLDVRYAGTAPPETTGPGGR